MTERVGNCFICGRHADVNTPFIDDENTLYCNNCAWKVGGLLLRGISQIIKDDKYVIDETNKDYMRDSCLVMTMGNSISAYIGNGHTAFYLSEDEEKYLPENILTLMKSYKDKGWLRCTSCGMVLKGEEEIGGRPLFAGVNCHACWKKHQEHLEDQRKRGAVCSMCREPYDNCCC